MNKQQGIIIGVLVLIISGGGYYFWQSGRKNDNNGIPPPKPSLEVVTDDTIFGWLARGSVECTVTTDTGDVKLMAKKEILRMEGIPYAFGNGGTQDKNGISLTIGDWMYMWSGTQGTKLNITELQKSMTPEQKAKAQNYSWVDTVKGWEASGFKYDCQEIKLDDKLFTPPGDVQFNDLTKTMTTAAQAADNIKSGNLTPEEVEAEMQKAQSGGN